MDGENKGMPITVSDEKLNTVDPNVARPEKRDREQPVPVVAANDQAPVSVKRKHNAPTTVREAVKAILEHQRESYALDRLGYGTKSPIGSDDELLKWDDWNTCHIVVRKPLEDDDAKAPYTPRGRTPAVLAVFARYGFISEKDLTSVHPCFEMAVRKRVSKGTVDGLPSVAELADCIRADCSLEKKHSNLGNEALVKGCLDYSKPFGYFWSFCEGC